MAGVVQDTLTRERIQAALAPIRKATTTYGAQAHLAADLHISRSRLSNWLRGRHFPPADLVAQACKLLDVPVRPVLHDLGVAQRAQWTTYEEEMLYLQNEQNGRTE